jgi:beta-lactamase regulating signal transducer with metallopeptidase domain
MNSLGIALMWCVAQVTLIGVLAAGLYLVLRRLNPAAAVSVLCTSMVVVIGLSLMAVSPWPRWTICQYLPLHEGTEIEPNVTAINDVSRSPDIRSESGEKVEAALGGNDPVSDMGRSSMIAQHWPAIVAALMLAAISFGLGWLVLGVLAVRRERLRSCPVLNLELKELVDALCEELFCRRRIEVRHSDHLTTAATIGWRRPVLLLPTDWTAWTAQQRRAVLAHEIVHARGHDYLALFFGQFALALHYYHPLLHWLMNRLRLQQELSADAAAASVSGGQGTYLRIIAELALRQRDRPLLWPARAFFPPPSTFYRRITMLRDTNLRFVKLSPMVRLTTIGIVSLCGLLAAGFRGPGNESTQATAADAPASGRDSGVRADNQKGIERGNVPTSEQEKLIAELKKLGATVNVDVNRLDKPIVGVDFSDSQLITDEGLAGLKGLNQLQYLYLRGTKITGAGLANLNGLTQLQQLDLQDTKIADAGLENLKGLTQLQILKLGKTKITDAGLANLPGLTKLQTLDLMDTEITVDAIYNLKRSLPSCAILMKSPRKPQDSK